MKNLKLISLLIFLSSLLQAQDSTKKITQEIGFNTVSLIKQLISNNPTNTLDQLPYTIFYNLYHKDKIGIRVGLGISNSNNKTEIEGQALPRTTKTSGIDVRTGVSYNFVKQNRVTLNVFADVLIQKAKTETVNTFTSQSFPDPVQKTTTTTTDITNGSGGQVGVGVKYNLYKHLSIYAEIPLSIMARRMTSQVLISEVGTPDDKTKTNSQDFSMKITVPTTIYLVLRF